MSWQIQKPVLPESVHGGGAMMKITVVLVHSYIKHIAKYLT